VAVTRRLAAILAAEVDGFTSLLVVPVGPHALLQAFQSDQRPWSRAQTNRALVLSYQLAPVLTTLAAHAPAA